MWVNLILRVKKMIGQNSEYYNSNIFEFWRRKRSLCFDKRKKMNDWSIVWVVVCILYCVVNVGVQMNEQ
jgi:hypothetical protein